MENLLFAADGIVPIFLVMLIGAFLKYKKLICDEFYNGASRFVFLVATPALLFMDTASVDFHKTFDPSFLGFILSALLIYIFILWITVPLFVKNRVKAGAMIHCAYRSNFAILGLPLLKNVLTPAGVAKAEIVLAFGVPVFNIVAVVCLAYWSQTKGDYKKTFKNIITNPLIVGAITGLLFSIFKIPVPQMLGKTINYFGNTALGLGLIVLGATFDIKKFISSIKTTITASMLKTVVAPLFGIVCAYLFGFRGDELLITLVFMGSSTAVNSFVMSKEMGSDSDLTSGIIVCTTALSILTLFLGLYLLKSIGLV